MIHLTLSDRHTVDLELEVHSKMSGEGFLMYITDWVECRPVQSKLGSQTSINRSVVIEFSTRVVEASLFKKFVLKHYGGAIWQKAEHILRCHASGGCGEDAGRRNCQKCKSNFAAVSVN